MALASSFCYNGSMRLMGWNVNGLRSCIRKGFTEAVADFSPDILSVQEVKGSEDMERIEIPGYRSVYSHADKKGYSGTAVFFRNDPISVSIGLEEDEFSHEGRVITLEYPDWYLVNVYVPNSQEELKRIGFRLAFDEALRRHITRLRERKGVIATGDFNVAIKPIDLKNPKSNEGHAGYSAEERESFQRLLDTGMIDSFRYYYPDLEGAYSWWSYMFHARERNAGWRIDYFLVADELKDRMSGAGILSDVMGSDHAPVFLDIT